MRKSWRGGFHVCLRVIEKERDWKMEMVGEEVLFGGSDGLLEVLKGQ